MKAGGTKYQTCSARYSLGILSLSSHTLHLFVTEHLLVQFFLHFVKEIGAALVLPTFDVDVETVTVL